jgi:hypothetical protein
MGSPRSGSSWLSKLLRDSPSVVVVHEPLIGLHLGLNAADGLAASSGLLGRLSELRTDDEYFFAQQHADVWQPALRSLILTRLAVHVPKSATRCVVHEPNGSEGAPLLMRALPDATLVFLLRDGRDVVDSSLDAWSKGSWLDQAFQTGGLEPGNRLRFVTEQAHRWVARTRAMYDAYDTHDLSLRYLLRYEALRADTGRELRLLYAHLGWQLPDGFEARVDKLAFEAIPAADTGAGKFSRAASPGLWRENLSEEEQAICHDIMGPTLTSLGYVAE